MSDSAANGSRNGERIIEDANKAQARSFLAAASTGDIATIETLFAPDLVYQVMGSLPISGQFERASMIKLISAMFAIFPTGLHFTIDAMIAEGETVMATVRGEALTASGTTYHNNYVWVLTYRDGLLYRAQEYYDTKAAETMLLGNRPPGDASAEASALERGAP